MPTERRYWTVDGLPPNGGLPPPQNRVPIRPPATPTQAAAPPPPYTPPAQAPAQAPNSTPTAGGPSVCVYPGWIGIPMTIPVAYAAPTPAPPPPPPPPPTPAPPPPATAPATTTPKPTFPIPPGAKINGTTIRLANGQGYLFPNSHTTLHIITANHFPWQRPQTNFAWMSLLVPTSMTVAELIVNLGVGEGGDPGKNGVTECLEVGGGLWLKGSSFMMVDRERCQQRLASVGWDVERGGEKKPVWLAVHKGVAA